MFIIQFTGLSGSGKTTLAMAMKNYFSDLGYEIEVLDGDELRKSLSKDLGFCAADRIENNRRIGDLALEKLIQGKLIIISTINPYEISRIYLKSKTSYVFTVYTHASIESLIRRDTKGLYKMAMNTPAGSEILKLSGINDPYEIPKNPDLILCTDTETEEESISRLRDFIILKLQTISSYP